MNLDTFMKVQEGLCFDGEYINLLVIVYRVPFVFSHYAFYCWYVDSCE